VESNQPVITEGVVWAEGGGQTCRPLGLTVADADQAQQEYLEKVGKYKLVRHIYKF
jgi:hypothetical protein